MTPKPTHQLLPDSSSQSAVNCRVPSRRSGQSNFNNKTSVLISAFSPFRPWLLLVRQSGCDPSLATHTHQPPHTTTHTQAGAADPDRCPPSRCWLSRVALLTSLLLHHPPHFASDSPSLLPGHPLLLRPIRMRSSALSLHSIISITPLIYASHAIYNCDSKYTVHLADVCDTLIPPPALSLLSPLEKQLACSQFLRAGWHCCHAVFSVRVFDFYYCRLGIIIRVFCFSCSATSARSAHLRSRVFPACHLQ